MDELFDRFAAAEERFRQSQFLAPALPGGLVHVRLEGIIVRLRLDGNYRGWGVFRPTGPATAALVRPASLAERRRYLELFPRRKVILCHPQRGGWQAWPAHHGDRRFGPPALVSVRLAEETQPFDLIQTRFDGVQCWFEQADTRADPGAAAYLRQALAAMTPLDHLDRRGLSGEERAAYGVLFARRREAIRDRTEDQLRAALGHAGAELAGYAERPDGLRVEYVVDGERHVSVVDRGDLSLQLAGICLSGEDRHFDLASLVGVLREARDGVLRIGDNVGLAEEQYWRVHPRR
jgi:hypothetical protein